MQLPKPGECTAGTVNLNVNYGLLSDNGGYQCRFIDCSKCAPLLWGVGSGQACARVGSGGTGQLSASRSVLLGI